MTLDQVPKPIAVMLVDDHEIVRQALALMLSREDELTIVGEAANGRDALCKAPLYKPQVIVIDVSMPSMNGVELTQELKRLMPRVKVVGLSAHAEPEFLDLMLRAGVSGYVVKSDSFEELITAILAAVDSSTEIYLSESVRDAAKHLKSRGDTQGHQTKTTILSARERQTLQLLAKGLPNHQIADQMGVGIKTVETYRRRTMNKLNVRSSADLIKKAIALGLAEL